MATIPPKVSTDASPVILPSGWSVSGDSLFDGLTQSWKATHDEFGQGLLKHYRGWALAPDEIGEFNEWFSKRRIHHPGWPNEYASGICKGVPWVIEHSRNGETLGQRMTRFGRPPIADTINLGIQLAQILEVAHQNQLAHGVLSPELVLFQENPTEPFLLLEIGVLPHVVQGGIDRLKAVVSQMDPFRFMAPETLQGRGVTNFSDIFSLGALLYWSLTGEAPFTGDTPEEVFANQPQKPPRTPPELRMGVPQGLSQLVMRMLTIQPGHRLKSMAEVASTLERIAKLGNQNPLEGYDVSQGKGRPAPGSAGALQEELDLLEKHLFQHPADETSLYKKAQILFKLGCFAKAVKACETAIDHNPRLGHVWQLKGQCLLDMDEPKKALEIWNRLSKAIPGNAKFHTRRAQAHIRLHELDQASAALKAAEKCEQISDGEQIEIPIARADILKVQKHFDTALHELDTFLKAHPHNADALCLRHEVKVRLKDPMGALEDLTEAVRSHPSHIPSRSAKARLLLAKNRAEEATEDVDQLVDRQPNCLDHRLLRIQQRLSIGDPATALEDANHMAKDALPGDEILRHQAWLLACIGDGELRDPKEALEIARQGCDATGGSDPDWLETLAAAWASLNQFEGAIGWQTKALQILDDCALPEQQSRLELYKAHKPFRLK